MKKTIVVLSALSMLILSGCQMAGNDEWLYEESETPALSAVRTAPEANQTVMFRSAPVVSVAEEVVAEEVVAEEVVAEEVVAEEVVAEEVSQSELVIEVTYNSRQWKAIDLKIEGLFPNGRSQGYRSLMSVVNVVTDCNGIHVEHTIEALHKVAQFFNVSIDTLTEGV